MMPMMANNFQNALAQRALALPQNAAPQPQPAQMQTTMMPLATHIQPGAQPVGAPQFNGGPMQAAPVGAPGMARFGGGAVQAPPMPMQGGPGMAPPGMNGGPMQAMPGPQIPRNSLRSRLGMPSTM